MVVKIILDTPLLKKFITTKNNQIKITKFGRRHEFVIIVATADSKSMEFNFNDYGAFHNPSSNSYILYIKYT